jgi:hypothetical protein
MSQDRRIQCAIIFGKIMAGIAAPIQAPRLIPHPRRQTSAMNGWSPVKCEHSNQKQTSQTRSCGFRDEIDSKRTRS